MGLDQYVSARYEVLGRIPIPFTERVGKYLEEYRGIKAEVAQRFGLGEAVRLSVRSMLSPEDRQLVDTWNWFVVGNHPVLVVPLYTDSGVRVGFQLRSMRSKAFLNLYSPFGKFYQPLFGVAQQLEKIVALRAALLVEGVFDALAMLQISRLPVVSPLTSSVARKTLERLSTYVEDLVLMFDNDRAGEDGAKRVEKVCRQVGVRVHRVGYVSPDPNDLVKSGIGVSGVVAQISTYAGVFQAMHQGVEDGEVEGVSSGT